MAKSLGALRFLLWIGILLFLLWFLLFCFGSAKLLETLSFNEAPSYMLRLYGIFPLGWAVLFLLALKDIEKNSAIVNAAIITGILTVISIVVFHFVCKATGAFHWISAVVMLIYSLLLYFFKPEFKKQQFLVLPDFSGRKPLPVFWALVGPSTLNIVTVFSDYIEKIEQIVAEGDLVVSRFSPSGTFEGKIMGISPGEKRVTGQEIAIHRIVNRKIVEQWTVSDSLGLYQQLGLDLKPKDVKKQLSSNELNDGIADATVDNKSQIKYPVLEMGIPYQLIGSGFGFLLGIWAFVVADTLKGRVFIAAAMLVIFFLPVIWRSSAASLISFFCWIIYGIGCYFFLRMRGVGLR